MTSTDGRRRIKKPSETMINVSSRLGGWLRSRQPSLVIKRIYQRYPRPPLCREIVHLQTRRLPSDGVRAESVNGRTDKRPTICHLERFMQVSGRRGASTFLGRRGGCAGFNDAADQASKPIVEGASESAHSVNTVMNAFITVRTYQNGSSEYQQAWSVCTGCT